MSVSISGNDYLTGTLPQANWTGPLLYLDVSFTKFRGRIPSSLGNMTGINYLDLSSSGFSGALPATLGNLEHLSYLNLNFNNLSGSVDFEMFASLKILEHLSLQSGGLNVLLQSDGNCSFPRLQFLDMSGCKLTKFPYFLGSSPKLKRLYLGGNILQGPLPQSLANFTVLSHLNVSYNEIYDTFPLWLNATSQLSLMYLQSNKFYGVIQVPIPPQLTSISLSHNAFSGRLPVNFLLNSSARLVDLANNNFGGPLPVTPPSIQYYFISDNNFTGEIPEQICSSAWLEVIDVSNNNLTGSIPYCFKNFKASLLVMDLRANKFGGNVPDIFVQLVNLRTIRLSQNQLGGTLPRSLEYCESLEVLDVSENELEGSFPYWLEALLNLQVLVLRSNKFYGPVDDTERNNDPFQKLRIFDLSNNNFYGSFPMKYISKLKTMKDMDGNGVRYRKGDHYYHYEDSIVLVMKGRDLRFGKTLTLMTILDFSSNFFEGEIPQLVGDLKALVGLNFSHNNLCGTVPSSMGDLTNIEMLDLSSNKLDGRIPKELTNIVYLSSLNLSSNLLVGPIPQGSQFDTFTTDSFDENPGLCGPPLPKACGSDARQAQPSFHSFIILGFFLLL